MGPCLFCGAFVCSPDDQELFNRDSKKGHKFREQYMRKFQIKVREGEERERERKRIHSLVCVFGVVYMHVGCMSSTSCTVPILKRNTIATLVAGNKLNIVTVHSGTIDKGEWLQPTSS